MVPRKLGTIFFLAVERYEFTYSTAFYISLNLRNLLAYDTIYTGEE